MTPDDPRAFCPYCGEPIPQRPWPNAGECPTHGVLDGLSTAEWQAIERERDK